MGERAAAYIMRLRDFFFCARVCVCVWPIFGNTSRAHTDTHFPFTICLFCHTANPLYATPHYSPHAKWNTPLSFTSTMRLGGTVTICHRVHIFVTDAVACFQLDLNAHFHTPLKSFFFFCKLVFGIVALVFYKPI